MGEAQAQIESAVPANRLGQLLVEARLREGTDLEILAQKSAFTVGDLRDLEAGHRLLDDQLVEQVTGLYEIDCGPIVPQRNKLTIDLDDHLLTAAAEAVPLESSDRDHVLERYLALVYLLRNNTPGAQVTLRDEDLDILAASLAERRELIEEQLLRSMDPENQNVGGLFRSFRTRLWVPAAGVLVGATSIGALVLLAAPTSGQFIPPEQVRAEVGGTSQVNNLSAPAPNTVITPTTSDPTSNATTPSSSSTTVTRPASVIASQAAPLDDDVRTVAAEAEALLPFDWQEILPNWEINYLAQNDSFRGLTYPYDATIEIFVRDTDTPESLAPILAHEIGHAVDVSFMSGSDREAWLEERGIQDAPWWADAFASDFQSGAGDFAEAFAALATGDQSSSQIADHPTEEQLEFLSELLEGVLPPA